jgi:putative toxin-antitoxin system antitoxin component (TIGR02293 family)
MAAPSRTLPKTPTPPTQGPEAALLAQEPCATHEVAYRHTQGVEAFVQQLLEATPMEVVETERAGVTVAFLKDLSKRLGLPVVQLYRIIGLPKATAERKAAAGESVAGSPGLAALGLARLLGIALDIVERSTSEEAAGFDAGHWLGRWIERPQRALGGLRPADFVDTPTGMHIVARLLGAIESGAYQ